MGLPPAARPGVHLSIPGPCGQRTVPTLIVYGKDAGLGRRAACAYGAPTTAEQACSTAAGCSRPRTASKNESGGGRPADPGPWVCTRTCAHAPRGHGPRVLLRRSPGCSPLRTHASPPGRSGRKRCAVSTRTFSQNFPTHICLVLFFLTSLVPKWHHQSPPSSPHLPAEVTPSPPRPPGGGMS